MARSSSLRLIAWGTVFAAAGAAVAFSCKATRPQSAVLDEPAAETPVVPPPMGEVCDKACADPRDDRAWAVCYSCKCKQAMGGYLPKASELSCSNGAEIAVYRGQQGPEGMTLTKVTGDAADCLNPPRLPDARRYGSGCFPGSKLGQLQKDDVYFKWICRREKFHANYTDDSLVYEDSGIIGYNAKTGATCFWDDSDEVTNGTNTPEIDLSDGDEAKITAFLATFYRQEGDSCIGCHDNDPFMYSPYLRAAKWDFESGHVLENYRRVLTDGSSGAIGRHLVSPEVAKCTSCHRIGESGTCGFALDSLGLASFEGLQEFMKGDLPENWGSTTVDGIKWTWPVWMPAGAVPATHAAYQTRFGKVKEHLQKCCNDPDAAECKWEPVPTGL